MKWFSFLFVVCAAMVFISPSVAFTEAGKSVKIQSISHSKSSAEKEKETITFKMDAAVVPKIFTLRGEKPRLVIDFPESIYLGKNVITPADGLLALTIRVGIHQTPVKRTRVVVDLAKEMDVQYASDYSDQDNSLLVTLTPGTVIPPSPTGQDLQTKDQQTLPSQEELAARPLDKKPIPPVFSVKDATKVPAGPSTTSPAVPTILEVSFDDSSGKGEMVLFRLNDFYPPTVSAIEKDTPRVLCDFMAMELGPNIQEIISPKGKYIQRIRTARHHDPEKVRVVLELSTNRDYDLQQVFFRNDNLFVLIVNELAPDQGAEKAK